MYLLRVNMHTGSISKEPVEEDLIYLGGRGLSSKLIARDVPAHIEPLGNNNKLILAPGLLTGTSVPSSGRLSIGAKSPLTGTIKESNVGGTAGQRLARFGIKAIIIEEKPVDNSWYVLHVNSEKIELLPADYLAGKGNYDTAKELRKRYGDKVSIVSIGPAGESCFSAATVAVTNIEGNSSRHAGRGGMGAVMGSKQLKAIIVAKPDSTASLAPQQPERYKKAIKRFALALKSHPTTGKVLPTYGTTTLVKMVNELGALPTRNYSSGQFERAEEISGDTFLNLISQRGGRTGHACHPGCVIKCSNVFNSSEGEYVTSGLEYETIGMLGANCGISSLDVIAKADRLCDDLGLDTVETGAAIGIAMEAGILNFGDGEAMLSLIREVGKGTIMGRLLGHGSVITGKVLGVNRVPAVKGQSMAAYDPRTLKGVGVTYATSPMGADHTGGNGLGGDVDPLKPEGQIEYSIKFQEAAAYFDSLGLCWFTRAPILGDLTLVTEIANSLFGTDWGPEDIVNIGKMVMRFEKDFNKRAGFNESHDRLPEFMLTEKNRPHETVFDVSAPEMAKLFSKNT